MIRLYLKTLFAVVVLISLLLFGYQVGFSYFANNNTIAINQLLSKGTFAYLQSVLSKTPEEKWQSILAELQPNNTPAIKIIPIRSLRLTDNEKAQLLNGTTIFKAKHNRLFLNYGLINSIALQRIQQSDYALQLMLGVLINQTIQDLMQWPIHIINYQLKHTEQKNQKNTLKTLQTQFGVPLKLISSSSTSISNSMKQHLSTYAIAYFPPKEGEPITTFISVTAVPNKLLVVGPMVYSPLSSRFSTAQRYYFISFSISAILIVIGLTWLFSRNTLKIYQLTQQYSKGNFDFSAKINTTSILYDIYLNITAMGNELKKLMRSQKNMTQFVAHEIRTPLSTLQLTLDSLKKSDDKNIHQEKLASMQDDIEQINQLIGYFLMYYKTTSHELKLTTETIDISTWLKMLVTRYHSTKITIKLTLPAQEILFWRFDPTLLRHAVDNLITNALKFAKSSVNIALAYEHNTLLIHVDDDGPGITIDEIKTIFEPFVTLSSNQTFGKHVGLGLTIAKAIIQLHRGDIFVIRSQLLGGARFTISLSDEN